MKKTLLFLSLIIIGFYGSAQQFEYEWHDATDIGTYNYATNIVVHDTTIYMGHFITISDSIDMDPSTNELWFYNPDGQRSYIVSKWTENGQFLDAFMLYQCINGIQNPPEFEVSNDGNIIFYGSGIGTSGNFSPSGSTVNSYTATGPTDQYTFVSFYNGSTGLYIGHFEYSGVAGVHIADAEIDNQNNLYLGGNFYNSLDFDFTNGVDNHTTNGSADVFIMKINLANNTYEWTKTFGGTLSDDLAYITISNNSLFITGWAASSLIDMDPGAGIDNLTSLSSSNQFVSKLDLNGVYDNAFIINGDMDINGISSDSQGNIYIFGGYQETDIIDVDPSVQVSNLYNSTTSNDQIYLIKYDNNLDLVWQQSFISDGSGQFYSYDFSGIVANDSYIGCTFYKGGNLYQSFNGGLPTLISASSVMNFDPAIISIDNSTGNVNDVIIYPNSGLYVNGLSTSSNGALFACGRMGNGSVDFNPLNTIVENETISSNNYFITRFNLCNIDSTITQLGGTFTSNQQTGNYEWIDCSSGLPILGETNQSFTPTINGSYSLHITDNDCEYVTNCFTINNVGINENLTATIQISPNPTNNTINIQSKTTIQQITIVDINGRVVLNEKVNSKTISNINVSQLNNGIYFIKVIDEKRNSSINKIIKQ